MRRLFTPSTIVPCVIIAAVVAMVVSANIREGRSNGRPSSMPPPLGAPGAPITSRDGLAKRVSEMEARIASRPDDVGAAVLLSDALIRLSRVTGNAGLSIRAEQALAAAAVEAPGNYDVMHAQGSLLLSQHRFREALVVAERCRAQRPSDPTNYGVLGDAHLELGEYDAAFDAFDQMMKLRPSATSYSRVAYARELQGDLSGALQSMKLAADASSGSDVEATAWYHAQVGELYLQLKKPYDAMLEFATASQAFPGHPFAVRGYAKALVATGKPAEALPLLQGLVATSLTPELYAQLGDVLTDLGRPADAAREYALAEASWRSDAPEPKNLARFLAERGWKLDEAVQIAETAAAARQDIFTQDALAWAYFRSGRIDDARHTIDLALRTGSRDPDLRRHAASIQAATTNASSSTVATSDPLARPARVALR